MKKWDDLSEEQQAGLIEEVAGCCGDMYWCDRMWSAWSYGTMSQDDFHPAEECDDFISDVAKAVYERAQNMEAGKQPATAAAVNQ